MNPTTWTRLTSYESLLAIGMTLVMTGIVLRGFARNARRNIARRKQHLLDERKSADAGLNAQLDRSPGWIEEHLGLIANAVLVAGLGFVAVSIFRK